MQIGSNIICISIISEQTRIDIIDTTEYSVELILLCDQNDNIIETLNYALQNARQQNLREISIDCEASVILSGLSEDTEYVLLRRFSSQDFGERLCRVESFRTPPSTLKIWIQNPAKGLSVTVHEHPKMCIVFP